MELFCSLAKSKRDNECILHAARFCAGRFTDNSWDYHSFTTVDEVTEWFNADRVVDIMSWDLSIQGSLNRLEQFRSRNPKTFLIIVSDETLSPAVYLKPSISPGALLLKPVNMDSVMPVMQEIFASITNREASDKELFLVSVRDEKRFIPYAKIDCFEAREKKIYVRTKSDETGYYGSLDDLNEKLPSCFVRCHRSYIVNMNRAAGVVTSERYIMMESGAQIPFSRTYRKEVVGYYNHEH